MCKYRPETAICLDLVIFPKKQLVKRAAVSRQYGEAALLAYRRN